MFLLSQHDPVKVTYNKLEENKATLELISFAPSNASNFHASSNLISRGLPKS